MTPAQKNMLDAIKSAIDATGVCPSMQELADATGLKSKSGVHRIITALERAGHIARIPGAARSIIIPTEKPNFIAMRLSQIARLATPLENYSMTRKEVASKIRQLTLMP